MFGLMSGLVWILWRLVNCMLRSYIKNLSPLKLVCCQCISVCQYTALFTGRLLCENFPQGTIKFEPGLILLSSLFIKSIGSSPGGLVKEQILTL